MVDRAKLLIILYVVVGVALTLLGFLLLISINRGLFIKEVLMRMLMLGVSIVMMFLGTHFMIVGIVSLIRLKLRHSS